MAVERPYCRLTVSAPRHRVDVALPADIPVADLVPMLLALVGEPAPGGPGRAEPWRLSGVAGGPLPAAATLSELGVLDGDLLRIERDGPPPSAPVFDDPVDALAAGAGVARAGDPRFGAAAVLLVVLVAAGLLAASGPYSTVAAVAAGVAALTAVGWVARAVRDPGAASRVARTAALAAVPLAAAAGWTAAGGTTDGAAPLLAVAAAGTAAAVAQVVLRVVSPALIATVATAVLVTVGLVVARAGLTVTAAAAGVAALAVVAGPSLARVAIRLAGLPRPVVPTDGSELVDADDGPDLLPPGELAERADLARGYLAGLAGAAAVVAAGGAVVAASAGGWAGPSFAAVTVVVLGLRARGHADVVPARAALVAAVGAGLALAWKAAQGGEGPRWVAVLGLLAVAAVGTGALGRTGPAGSPVTRRAVDLLEGVLVAASVPLALAAMDLYRLVREL